jgi:thioredoxin 1
MQQNILLRLIQPEVSSILFHNMYTLQIFKYVAMNLLTMGNENVLQVTSGNWDTEVLKSEKPVFVDFWAEWCGPCRMVGPVVEQIAQTHSDKIKVVKLNVDENQDIAMKYGIQSIPSLMVFNKGKEVNRTVGAAPKETYLKFINDSISK